MRQSFQQPCSLTKSELSCHPLPQLPLVIRCFFLRLHPDLSVRNSVLEYPKAIWQMKDFLWHLWGESSSQRINWKSPRNYSFHADAYWGTALPGDQWSDCTFLRKAQTFVGNLSQALGAVRVNNCSYPWPLMFIRPPVIPVTYANSETLKLKAANR